MRVMVNDLSLAGQFPDADQFVSELRRLLDAREGSNPIKRRLFCSRSLGNRPATPHESFRSAVQSHRDRDLRQRVLRWVAQAGPFWDDDRVAVEEDLFHLGNEDVTLQGLGEAARGRLLGRDDAVYSWPGGGTGCDIDPLVVTQGLLEDRIGSIDVPNHLSIEGMREAAIRAAGTPSSWVGLLAAAAEAYDAVSLADGILRVLRPHPFSAHVAERVMELLGVLDDLVKSRDAHGEFTDRSKLIVATHFAGGTARFTDESKTNKNDFREEMTFPDPDDPKKRIFAPFHGKINNPAYRIHIRWPLESVHEKAAVLYIGPKITK